VPDFIEVHYLFVLLAHIEDKLLPDFYKYFSLPREDEWKDFLDNVKRLSREQRSTPKTNEQGGKIKRNSSLPF